VPTKAEVKNRSNGAQAGENKPLDPNYNPAGATAIIHTHDDWGFPFPGPEDGMVPSAFGIPNYGISPVGAWVVNPGPPLAVELLAGSWGTGADGESFDPVAYDKAINKPGSGGKQSQCK
jgi:hypothetical protein